jgi:hypothetical protein
MPAASSPSVPEPSHDRAGRSAARKRFPVDSGKASLTRRGQIGRVATPAGPRTGRPPPWKAAQAPEALVAEHGFSVLVMMRKNDSGHQILFDAETSPGGVTDNMRLRALDV